MRSETCLAHISDLHLPPPPIPWTSFFNKRLLSRAFWQKKRRFVHQFAITEELVSNIEQDNDVQALLISGDQTNFGTMEEYRAAARWLGQRSKPALVVPGNHDFMAPASYQKSLALWQDWSGSGYPYLRLIDKIAIIGLNSAHPTLPFASYGFLTPQHYRALKALLHYCEEKNYCRVVMIHHPPRKDLLPWHKSLLDTTKLAHCLKDCGAELVLHGHSHNATLSTVEGTAIPLLGVSSASLNSTNKQRISSWNKLCFSQEEIGWHISVTRKNYKNERLAEYSWYSSAKGSRCKARKML